MLAEDRLFNALKETAKNSVNIKETEIARVISTNPIQINLKGLLLVSENICINENLIDHTRNFKKLTGTIGNSITSISDGSICLCGILKKDDFVAVREMDNGMYYISNKVVGGDVL